MQGQTVKMAASMLRKMLRRASLVESWQRSLRFHPFCSVISPISSPCFNISTASRLNPYRPIHRKPNGNAFRLFPFPTLQRSTGYATGTNPYYVLLPEVPPDTPETNPIMRLHDYPQFSRIHPDGTITGCAKLAIEFDVEMERHVEALKDGSKEKSFEAVFEPIERLVVPLSYAWRTTKNLNYTCGAVGFRAAFTRIHPQVTRGAKLSFYFLFRSMNHFLLSMRIYEDD